MSTPTPRVQVPRSAAKGEIVKIKALIEHQMETGLRRDSSGEVIPRRSRKSRYAVRSRR